MPRTETPASAELAVIDTPEQAIAMLRGAQLPEIEDPEAVARNIMERILAAENPDDVLGGNAAVHAQDVLGRPFKLHGVRFMRSRYENGPGAFAVLDAEFGDNGERAAVTCSSRNVMAQAVRLWQLEALPLVVAIERSENQTAAGFYPLWLARPETVPF